MKRIGVIAILILAFCGLADSAYITQNEINGTELICNVQSLSGCNTVAGSQYSHLFGIPLSEYGVLFYGILFIIAALELALFDRFLRRVLQVISLIGIVASLYFTSVQVFFIGAFCIYCLASAITTLLVLIFASFIEPMRRKENNNFHIEHTQHLTMPPAP